MCTRLSNCTNVSKCAKTQQPSKGGFRFRYQVEDDGLDVEYGEIEETGFVGDDGELRRPWCPETRVLDHREMEQQVSTVAARQLAHICAATFFVNCRVLCTNKRLYGRLSFCGLVKCMSGPISHLVD